MVERKKGGAKRKEKETAELPKQKTLLDMFPLKAVKVLPTVISLESSPEVLDIPLDSTEEHPALTVLGDDRSGNVVVGNETPQSSKPGAPASLHLSNPSQAPSSSAISSHREGAAGTMPNYGSLRTLYPFIHKIEGMTPSTPIVLDATPVKESTSKPLPKLGVVHPFFVPRGNTTKQRAPRNPHNPKGGWPVPYPDRVSQHVRGPQTLVPPSSTNAPRRHTQPITAAERYEDSRYGFLMPGLHSPYSTPKETITHAQRIEELPSLRQYTSTIPTAHLARYPSISRMVDRSLSMLPQAPNGRTLAEKWRPRCAEEVLGNETSAQYLRNWLRALELQLENSGSYMVPVAERPSNSRDSSVPNKSRKRPRVIREVARTRYRKRAKPDSDGEDDNWIVADDDDDDDDDEAYSSSHYASDFEIDTTLPSSSPMLSTGSLPDSGSELLPNLPKDLVQDLGELHNTILLVGPPGSGKTASVYACAEELDWEVFEVYPGIGRRSGSSVENLVGEVGKNHLVRQRPHGPHDFVTFRSPSKHKLKQGPSSWLNSEPDLKNARSSVPPAGVDIEDLTRDRPASFTQSLILLEEVDILFKEDHRFWETVKNVIRDCKRPVILTCNDISLIPVDELPLQRVLYFDACPSDILISYLQAICCAEGRSVGRVDLWKCIASREGHEESQTRVSDLRRAINTLDLLLTGGFPQVRSETAPSGPRTLVFAPEPRFGSGFSEEILGRLTKAVYEADTVSLLDSELSRNELDRPAAIEIESLGHTGDDEMGHPILHDTRVDASLPSTYRRDIEMGTAIRERMGLETESGGVGGDIGRHYGTVLGEVCPVLVALWKGQAHLFTEYAPYIKQVAAAEEAAAAALLRQAQSGRGRRTRNSALSSHHRTIDLSEQGREGLAGICFGE